MARSRRIEVEIVGDSSSVERAFGRASNAGKRFSVGFGTFVKGAVIFEGVRRGIDLVADSIRSGASEWSEQAKVTAQTNAAIKSTEGIANVTAKAVDNLANSIQRYSGFDDEAIQHAENLLLTFKRVRNEVGEGNRVFDRATKAAADLAARGFGSLDSNAVRLGKALADPVRGITALRRAGVDFTEGQKATIKSLVETGRLLEAQKLILREVEAQVSGSARAFGQTLPGQLARLKETARNVFGDLVGVITPALTKGLAFVNRFFDDLAKARTVRAKLNVVLETGRELATEAFRVAEEVRNRIGEALAAIDWRQVGRDVGDGLARGLSEVAAFVQRVDWGKVGQAIVRGIADFLKGVNWPAVLRATGILIVRAIIALEKLLFNASKELGRQILLGIAAGVRTLGNIVVDAVKRVPEELVALRDLFKEKAKDLGRAIVVGIGTGLDNAKDAVIRKLLQFVNKILGVTGFLGRFDPFKGVREKVQARLKDMEGDARTSAKGIQRSLNGIKGKDVTIGVKEQGTRGVQSAINGIKGKDVLIRISTIITEATTVGADRRPAAGGAVRGEVRAAVRETRTVEAEEAAQAQVAAAKRLAEQRKAAAAEVRRAAAQAEKAKTAAIEAFQVLFDSLSLGLEQAQATKSLKDDIRALDKQEAAIRDEIKVEGRTTELLRQLFQVRQQRQDVQRQQAEQQQKRRQARQFRTLGLTDEGEKRAPGIGALTGRLKSLREQVKGTVLDTGKTGRQFDAIAKVLAEGPKKVGRNMRLAILQMFKDISSALDQDGDNKQGPLTKFVKQSGKDLIEGLGLTVEQARELQQRLAQRGPGGTVPRAGIGAFGMPVVAGVGAGAGGRFVIENHLTVEIDGKPVAKTVTKEQQKTKGRGARSRRGRQ